MRLSILRGGLEVGLTVAYDRLLLPGIRSFWERMVGLEHWVFKLREFLIQAAWSWIFGW
jgi:hypothetical protein